MDLPTLWYLTIGTLLIAFAMTLWERKAHAPRSRELDLWAAAYAAFAVGCVLAMNRAAFPGVVGPALTNVVMMLGYLLVLQGAAALDGKGWRPSHIACLLAAIGAAWLLAGAGWGSIFWNHVSAFPIAAISALTAFTLYRSRTAKGLRSRPIAIAVFVCHSAFYGARTFVVPVIVALYGDGMLPIVAKMTMYEAVLFSVAMPMSFLALVREEERAGLLAASRTDYLTGLNNRHGFFELGAELLRQQGTSAPHSLLAFDLDHFKTINDKYGHDAGDRVLKLFASIARETAGPDAMGVRLGGEEFAILLPNTAGQEARAVGQSVAERFAEMTARADGLGIPATVSVGLAEAGTGDVDLTELLAAADRALYRAKKMGRNRIEIAKPRKIGRAA
ncbi:GGDEF domain-containing protein [Bosea sp. NBC_00550]|uniref:GGDEF domain-containing protein n=1 Tax=Bosea sp. NBC_00550 TaxID=2969621 RepID=UPI0022318917|nr:GGDEF domain-containing protein [Bosea sp. NBC_00550]UZF93210.1 GGDEF domain-containing protein [Bosea sp. NBC_00550]